MPTSPTRPVDRRAYTVPEVAAILGLPLRSTYLYVPTGAIRSRRLGGRIIVPAEEVDRLLAPPPSPEADAAAKQGAAP